MCMYCFDFLAVVSDLLFSSVRVPTNIGESRGTILETRLDGYHFSTLLDTSYGPVNDPVVTGLIYAMDYDLSDGIVYYGDRNSSTLWQVPLQRLTSSQDDRKLLLSGVTAWDMAYDWIHGYIYWTDDRYIHW